MPEPGTLVSARVGSTVTGKTRAGSASQEASRLTSTLARAPVGRARSASARAGGL